MRLPVIILFGIASIICLIILIVICSVVVPEYHNAKTYEHGRCRLTGYTYNGWKRCSFCTNNEYDEIEWNFGNRGPFYPDDEYMFDIFSYDDVRTGASMIDEDSSSQTCYITWYPCLIISATYTKPLDADQTEQSAVFFDYAFQDHDCSVAYGNCDRYPFDNAINVKNFRQRILFTYNINKTFDCYYEGARVIAHIRYSYTEVLHAILWPLLGHIVFGAIFLICWFSVSERCARRCSAREHKRKSGKYKIPRDEEDDVDGMTKSIEVPEKEPAQIHA